MQVCAECYNNILFNENSCSPCLKGVQWDVDRNDGLLDFDPSKQFPTSEITIANRKLHPMKMMHDKMKATVAKAQERFALGDLS